MKRNIILIVMAIFCLSSCYDDSALIGRIDQLEQVTVTALQTSISGLETRNEELKKAISQMEESQSADAEEISNLKKEQSEIDKTISDLKTWMENVLQGYCSKEEMDKQFKSMNETISKLNETITAMQEDLKKFTKKFRIVFNDSEIGITPGGKAEVTYKLEGATDSTVVKALAQNGWSAEVKKSGMYSGKIIVKAPNPMVEDEIVVIAYDGEFRTIMSSINFVKGKIFPSAKLVQVPKKGGDFEVTVDANIDYTVAIPFAAREWLSYVPQTKSMRRDRLTFTVPENTGFARSATVTIDDRSNKLQEQIVFRQDGASCFTKVLVAPKDWSGKYLCVFDSTAHATLVKKDLMPTVGVKVVNDRIAYADSLKPAVLTVEKYLRGSGYSIEFPDGTYLEAGQNSCVSSTEPFELNLSLKQTGVAISNGVYNLYENALSENRYYRFYIEKPDTVGTKFTLPSLYKLE